jgi:hypothetical protein
MQQIMFPTDIPKQSHRSMNREHQLLLSLAVFASVALIEVDPKNWAR